MKQIHDFLKKHNIKAEGYKKKGNVYFVKTKEKEYAIKKCECKDIYDYLASRSFTYYPKVYTLDGYEVSEVVSSTHYPKEQKLLDLISLTSLLHSKTTYYKQVEEDFYKKIYEDMKNNIFTLSSYYEGIIERIEKEIILSPSYLLFARCYSMILSSLQDASKFLDEYYEMVKDKTRARFCVIHNNLSLDHFMKTDFSYLLSWRNAKIDLPIYDLYDLFLKYGNKFDFSYYIKEYEKKYPFLEEEKILFYSLLSIPLKVEFKEEYETVVKLNHMIDLLYEKDNILYGNKKSKEE